MVKDAKNMSFILIILMMIPLGILSAQEGRAGDGEMPSLEEYNHREAAEEEFGDMDTAGDWFTRRGVTFYADGLSDLYGRSPRRLVVTTVLDGVYGYRESFDISGVLSDRSYYQTALVLDEDVRNRLVSLFETGSSRELEPGLRLSWKDEENRRVFSLVHGGWGLDISFSLTRPTEKMVDLIREVYSKDAFWQRWQQPVLEHYRSNYVIAIHRAENVFEPWEKEISYQEALLAAALIGDKDQWLWGIHNGRGLLKEVLEQKK